LGGDIVFHGVNIRPGKPVLFTTFGRKYYFGLPGNPISAAVGYQFFIRPLIRALQALPKLPPAIAMLDNPFLKKGRFRQFLKARAYINKSAQLCVEILVGQESFKVRPLLKANAWVVVEEEMTELSPGDLVPVVLMPYCNIEELL
jgi:molybdopterin molybdotransferase